MADGISRHDFGGDTTREVIGAYYDVYSALPRGLLESAYGGALLLELTGLGLPVRREAPLPVYYRGAVAGLYMADLLVGGKLILKLKNIGRLGDREVRQLYHHLRVTRLPHGLLLNSGVKAEVRRVINTPAD